MKLEPIANEEFNTLVELELTGADERPWLVTQFAFIAEHAIEVDAKNWTKELLNKAKKFIQNALRLAEIFLNSKTYHRR